MSEQSKLPYRIEKILITKTQITVSVHDGSEGGANLFIKRPRESEAQLEQNIADMWQLCAERVSAQFRRPVLEEDQS